MELLPGGEQLELNRVILDFDDNVAVLRFNHPEVMNAVGADMLEGLADAMREIEDPNNGARCLLITGVGRGFCAGANLSDSKRPKRGAGINLRDGYHPLFFALRDLEMPVVTAVNGAAAGVGMSFAMFGDIVCASKSAFFLQAFARIGLVRVVAARRAPARREGRDLGPGQPALRRQRSTHGGRDGDR